MPPASFEAEADFSLVNSRVTGSGGVMVGAADDIASFVVSMALLAASSTLSTALSAASFVASAASWVASLAFSAIVSTAAAAAGAASFAASFASSISGRQRPWPLRPWSPRPLWPRQIFLDCVCGLVVASGECERGGRQNGQWYGFLHDMISSRFEVIGWFAPGNNYRSEAAVSLFRQPNVNGLLYS